MRTSTRLIVRLGGAAAVAALVVEALAGCLLAEMTLHPGRRPVGTAEAAAAASTALAAGARVQDVDVRAADGGVLRGWLYTPAVARGTAVIALHGQADNRAAMIPLTGLLLRHGFVVLTPDSRAHGESDGNIATYGALERDDVRRWVEWLRTRPGVTCVSGLGESMGAGILLTALPEVPALCGAVAEAPFSTFRETAFDRIAMHSHLGLFAARTFLRPIVEAGLLYTRLRYGVALDAASPEDGLRAAHGPVLLIHGTADITIPLRHSLRLAQVGRDVSLWVVTGAGHTHAWAAAPAEFERRVVAALGTGRPQS